MSDPLSVLIPAVYTKLTGNSALMTAVGSRVYHEQYRTSDGTPPATFPYLVFFTVVDTPDYTYTSEYAELLMQFSIFDKGTSASTLLTARGALHALLDNTTLAVSGWTFLSMIREGSPMLVPDDIGVRASHSTYRIKLQKPE